jgi:hypothetical protein
MRKLLLAVAPAAALALGGCGVESKSCTTASAPVAPSGNCGAVGLRSDADVTVLLRAPSSGAGCQSCAQSSPSCEFDSTNFHLDTVYRECTEDADCGAGCLPAPPTFSCTFHTPAASGVALFYNTTGSTGVQSVDVGLSPNGATSCTL